MKKILMVALSVALSAGGLFGQESAEHECRGLAQAMCTR